MNPFNIALLQIKALRDNPDLHVNHGMAACRQAKSLGADLALFPEMWLSGYPPRGYDQTDISVLEKSAITNEAPIINLFCSLARELSMGIGFTYLEHSPVGLHNSMALISQNGEVILNYAKVHTCAFDWENKLVPGNGFPVVDFEYGAGTVCLGSMICMDREFPEAARILMLAGAEILLVPNACELEKHRLRQIEARAFENMLAIAVTNYPEPFQNGHSVAVSPVAFNRDEKSIEMILLEADAMEGVFVAQFDLDQIRQYRNREPWDNKYRHPNLYYDLIKPISCL